ncbi:MAG: hypothetical protein R2834_11160 [Rhodothermales bacterium]
MTIEKGVYYEMDVEAAPFTFAVTAFESLPPGIVKSWMSRACSELEPDAGWLQATRSTSKCAMPSPADVTRRNHAAR